MKKQVVSYMTICMLALAMVVQGQAITRPRQIAKPGDSTGRMQQRPQRLNRMAPFSGESRIQGVIIAVPGTNRMQRGGAMGAPGISRLQRGEIAPGFGSRNMQPGMQQGMQRGMQPGMQQGMQRGMQPGMQRGMQQGMPLGMQRGMQRGLQQGMQPGRMVNPEERIKKEVDQLLKALNLTSDQVKKITSIKEKQAKKEISRYKKAQKKMKARQQKVQAPNKKIESVLTVEQIKLFESSRSRLRISGDRNQR